MKDFEREGIEKSRPEAAAEEAIEFCLKRLYDDGASEMRDEIVFHLTHSEVIGALLLARDRLEGKEHPRCHGGDGEVPRFDAFVGYILKDREHELKAWPEVFQPAWTGEKTAEYRKFDRDFKVDDYLKVREWDNDKGEYTGRELTVRVTHIMTKWLPDGWAMISYKVLSRTGGG